MSELPQAESADPDAVQMALQAAQTLWSRGETTESLRWLKRAAESASDEGADLRSLQLAKAAAELRAKLFGASSSEAPASARPRDSDRRDSERPSAAPAGSDTALRSGAVSREGTGSEDSRPASVWPGTAPQYVVHRPREAQRQLMGLSSSTLETAVQRNGSSPSVPSWSAGAEARRSSSPPPLPRTSLDDYEELEAEPDEDPDSNEAAWAVPATSSWRPLGEPTEGAEPSPRRREAGSDSSPRVATLPPPAFGSSPPPLPDAAAFSEEEAEAMRAEQPTMFMPSKEEGESGFAGTERDFSPAAENPSLNHGAWDTEARLGRWDAAGTGTEPGWGAEARSSGWGVGPGAGPGSFESQNTAADSVPAKLRARVHHQAVRVSFAPDSRCPGQYVVRALRDGEKAREGERIALLVALEPGVPLV